MWRPRPIRVRARLRPKAQITLPEEIRRALRVSEGDEVEFTVREDGVITLRGYVSVPADLVWRYAAPTDRAQAADEPGTGAPGTMPGATVPDETPGG